MKIGEDGGRGNQRVVFRIVKLSKNGMVKVAVILYALNDTYVLGGEKRERSENVSAGWRINYSCIPIKEDVNEAFSLLFAYFSFICSLLNYSTLSMICVYGLMVRFFCGDVSGSVIKEM